MGDPYISAVQGRAELYREQRKRLRAVRAIVERCKKRRGYQNSFIETSDLETLEEITDTTAGGKYLYGSDPEGEPK